MWSLLLAALLGTYQPWSFQNVILNTTGTSTTATATFSTIGTVGSGTPTVMQVSLTTRGGTKIECIAAITAANSSNGGNSVSQFQLLLDGATVVNAGSFQADGGSLAAANSPQSNTLVGYTALLSAAAHTIALQWRVTNTGTTTTIATGTNQESASLLCREIAY